MKDVYVRTSERKGSRLEVYGGRSCDVDFIDFPHRPTSSLPDFPISRCSWENEYGAMVGERIRRLPATFSESHVLLGRTLTSAPEETRAGMSLKILW